MIDYGNQRELEFDLVVAPANQVAFQVDPVLSFAYVTGTTTSANFPLAGAFESTVNSNRHLFVSKLNPAGTALVYSTYLGGSGTETAGGIGGATTSLDFPGAVHVAPDAAAGSRRDSRLPERLEDPSPELTGNLPGFSQIQTPRLL